jgi:hypothetical protein
MLVLLLNHSSKAQRQVFILSTSMQSKPLFSYFSLFLDALLKTTYIIYTVTIDWTNHYDMYKKNL